MPRLVKGLPDDYLSLLAEVKERVRSVQYAALKAVNKQLVGLYWDIGRLIVERQAGDTWGREIVQRLAEDLHAEFPGTGGFSAGNLWRMRKFYEAYVSSEKLAPLVQEIAWSHNIVILERCKGPLEREFYIRMTRKFGWSKNVLIHQIDNQSYEKSLLGQTVQGEEPHDCGVRPARRPQADRRGDLSHRETAAQATERPTAFAGRDRQVAGGCGMRPVWGSRGMLPEIPPSGPPSWRLMPLPLPTPSTSPSEPTTSPSPASAKTPPPPATSTSPRTWSEA